MTRIRVSVEVKKAKQCSTAVRLRVDVNYIVELRSEGGQ